MFFEVALNSFVKGVSKTAGACVVLAVGAGVYVFYNTHIEHQQRKKKTTESEIQTVEMTSLEIIEEDYKNNKDPDSKYKKLFSS